MTKELLLSYFNKLCIELDLENEPPVLLIGAEAKRFIKNHYSNRNEKISISKTNAMFLYENLDEEYIENNSIDKRCIENGVICLIRSKKYSLVHEMRHAYQLKNDSEYMFLEEDENLKEEYKETYPYYPSEKDAFNYTIDYLRNEASQTHNINDGIVKYILRYCKIKLSFVNYLMYKLNYSTLKMEYYYRNKKYRNRMTIKNAKYN